MTKALRLRLLSSALIAGMCSALASCGEDEQPAVDIQRLATDVHVAIAEHILVLPFIALEDYAYRKQSFSFDRKGDNERALDAASKVLRDAANPRHPLALDELSVEVRTYGWNDFDMRQREMCPLLTREWARSVCDNPWAAIQQALPVNRFKLVDLRQFADMRGPFNCSNSDEQRHPLPQMPGEAVIVCQAQVYTSPDRTFYRAAVRIDENLGALWTVWGHGQNGETAEAMTDREGKAIVAFVQHALGASENFPTLHAFMCRLRRPNSDDSPKGADCAKGS
ncbi:hypothetical protein [Mesorhizobium sp. ANAO-SY3R2]|uniref:hypothetical protein n=1 Tax=Mesorhizobium sp. ANAO-SY3R2 TaxID=3166644 RepID=UPI00366E3831